MTSIETVLSAGAIHSVFQPIIELRTGTVVAYEALARGPEGPLRTPAALFTAARQAGRLAELDQACRRAAFEGAVQQRLLAPLTLFVNVEPEVLDSAPLEDLLAIAQSAPGKLRVVLEITERALATRPAELLRAIERVRGLSWAVALDDVGAEAASLAFMSVLRPDVVKLDLRLVQDRPGPAVADVMNAVNAYAESSGALVLAEGIENEAHLKLAHGLGATLGQGWLFGRPGPAVAASYSTGQLTLPTPPEPAAAGALHSPFSCLPETVVLRRSNKALLIELSKQLERDAMRLGEACMVAATFQEARHFTPATAARYRDLVARVGFVCALGEDLPVEPLPGLRGAALAADDPVRGEWDVVVLGPQFSVALLARDLGDGGPDRDRAFDYALTYRRDTVVAAAHRLLSRVAPRRVPRAEQRHPVVAAPAAPPALPTSAPAGVAVLQRALAEERDRAARYLARIEQLTYADPLTDLPNRRRIEERVETALWDVHAGGGALAMLFVDLDGFKAVNDMLGRAAGDQLLVLTARRLQARLRRHDLLARLGGDEFLVVLLGLDPADAHTHARQVAGQLADAVAAPSTLQGKQVSVSASIGISVCPDDAADFGQLLHVAGMRMYASKHPSPARPPG